MNIYKTEMLMQKGQAIFIFSNDTAPNHIEGKHTHEFIEIVYICSGEAVETVDTADYDVRRGDMIFINYQSAHSFKSKDGFKYVNICFSPEVVANSIITPDNAFSLLTLTAFNELCGDTSGGKLSFSGSERQEIENILDAMLTERQDSPPMSESVLACYMNILITKMLRKALISVGTEELDTMWNELVDYIDNNLSSRLTLPLLASKCFYNPSYFSRIFKERFKMSLTEYISRKRIGSAAKLLLDPNLTIENVYTKVGFSERSSFCSVFQKVMGCTPSEYRKENITK